MEETRPRHYIVRTRPNPPYNYTYTQVEEITAKQAQRWKNAAVETVFVYEKDVFDFFMQHFNGNKELAQNAAHRVWYFFTFQASRAELYYLVACTECDQFAHDCFRSDCNGNGREPTGHWKVGLRSIKQNYRPFMGRKIYNVGERLRGYMRLWVEQL